MRKIKQPKKLTLDQKKLLSRGGINPDEWMCRFEDKAYLHIVSKKSGKVMIVDKLYGEVTQSNYETKISSASDQTKRN